MAAGCRARRHLLVISVAMAIAMATAVFAAPHIRLVNEGSSGPLYECTADGCAPAQTDNPSRKNLNGMDFYVLPDGCVSLASVALLPNGIGMDVECRPGESTRRYRCEAGLCRPLESSADTNAAPIALPSECAGRIHELIALHADTDAPIAFVECDASSGPAGEI